jgi:membrane-associated protease RseP (regulator of RpoE activity)
MTETPSSCPKQMDPVYIEAVERHFKVIKAYWERTTPSFIIETRGEGFRQYLMKSAFKELAEELRGKGYFPRIRWIVDSYHLSIFKRKTEVEANYLRNKILFAATVFTVMLDGYLRSNNPILTKELMENTPIIVNVLIFTFSILVIFTVHEYGHRYIALKRGMDASQPYFIPAPPGMGGTLGAVISQREAPVNRDALFDLGLSGPICGFIATVFLAFLGMSLSFVVPVVQVNKWMIDYPSIRFQIMPMPKILEIIASIIKPPTPDQVLIMHPVAFAAWVGCIVTFINLIPSWQLDGGHIVRSLVGRESHKIVSVAGVFLLILSGYVVMGVVVAFFMMRQGIESIEPLDDLSPLSTSRKLGLILYVVVMLLSLVVLFPL